MTNIISENYVMILILICCSISNTESQQTLSNATSQKPLNHTPTPKLSQQIYDYQPRHVQWLCFNSSDYNCCQIEDIHCLESGPQLLLGYCSTYSEHNLTKSLYIAACGYFQPNYYHYKTEYIPIPLDLTELNDHLCGPLNRKGIVCSECADGFGPSVTSYGYQCANCTGAWYGIPLFLIFEFVPVTVLYFIVLLFQIRVTSPPMPCFMMFAQLVFVKLDLHGSKFNTTYREFIKIRDIKSDIMMIIFSSFYGLFSLEFFREVLPPFCINEKIKFIHIALIDCVSSIYPIFLILLTCACIELHDRNFKLIVWFWKPFHKCFVQLRRRWDPKSDIIDVFITFFFLSYTRSTYKVFLLLSNLKVITYTMSKFSAHQIALVDPTLGYFSKEHVLYSIPVILMLFLFNIFPLILLTIYPIRAFRSCLSRCRLRFFAINVFADKIQGCYRDGLNGGRDMRSLSGFYFFLRFVFYNISRFRVALKSIFGLKTDHQFAISFISLVSVLTVVLLRPYRKTYMNVIDAILLSNFTLFCFARVSDGDQREIVHLLLALPMLSFIIIVVLVKCYQLLKPYKYDLKILLRKCFKVNMMQKFCKRLSEPSSQPLTEASSLTRNVSYGSCS